MYVEISGARQKVATFLIGLIIDDGVVQRMINGIAKWRPRVGKISISIRTHRFPIEMQRQVGQWFARGIDQTAREQFGGRFHQYNGAVGGGLAIYTADLHSNEVRCPCSGSRRLRSGMFDIAFRIHRQRRTIIGVILNDGGCAEQKCRPSWQVRNCKSSAVVGHRVWCHGALNQHRGGGINLVGLNGVTRLIGRSDRIKHFCDLYSDIRLRNATAINYHPRNRCRGFQPQLDVPAVG